MPSKNKPAAEEAAEDRVIVCRAKKIWSNPMPIFRGNNYYFVTGGRDGHHLFMEHFTLEELARELYGGNLTSKPVLDPQRIDPRPMAPSVVYYIDGYFGRPPIPSTIYSYHPLKRKELKELKGHLIKLIREGQS